MTDEGILIKRAQKGDSHAMFELIKQYKKLIRSHAIKYVTADNAFELEDLVNVVCDGFMKGVQKFDIEKGYLLSTFVTHWMKKFLREAVALGINTLPYDETRTEFKDNQNTIYKAPISNHSIPFDNDHVLLVKDMLEKLPELDREIVKDYFGIKRESPLHIEKIAEDRDLDADIIKDIIQDSLKFLGK